MAAIPDHFAFVSRMARRAADMWEMADDGAVFGAEAISAEIRLRQECPAAYAAFRAAIDAGEGNPVAAALGTCAGHGDAP